MTHHDLRDPTFSRFDTIPECDRYTHRQTQDDGIYCDSIATRSKNVIVINNSYNTHIYT